MANTYVNLGADGEKILATYYEITSAASGTISFPSGATLIEDSFQDLEEALVSQTSASKPSFNAAVDAGGNRCVCTLNSAGAYSISPTPSSYPVAILYRVEQPLSTFNPTYAVLEDVERAGGGGLVNSASNVGGGNEVWKDLNGTDLRFRTVVAGANITVTQAANTITIASSASSNSYNPSGW